MTVAAVILYRDPSNALADAAGRPSVRRAVESAWAGGATPIVVVSFDPDGAIASALTGSPAVLAEPAPLELGPVAQMVRGMSVASEQVTETEAALIWPGRMVWVDAETVTSLIEAYGARRKALLRPVYEGQVGWPVLLPMAAMPAMESIDRSLMPEQVVEALAGVAPAIATIDTGDPGVTHDASTPIEQLPEFEGPPQPVAGHAPEWGAAAAEMPDDVPLEGPALAPYAQAAEEGE